VTVDSGHVANLCNMSPPTYLVTPTFLSLTVSVFTKFNQSFQLEGLLPWKGSSISF